MILKILISTKTKLKVLIFIEQLGAVHVRYLVLCNPHTLGKQIFTGLQMKKLSYQSNLLKSHRDNRNAQVLPGAKATAFSATLYFLSSRNHREHKKELSQ